MKIMSRVLENNNPGIIFYASLKLGYILELSRVFQAKCSGHTYTNYLRISRDGIWESGIFKVP